MNNTLVLTGTGDAMGVPRVYCECTVCTEARTDGYNYRTRCSAVIWMKRESIWIDCGPDWRAHMNRVGLRTASTILITHAHHDHIGGLPDVADMARWTKTKVTVFAPKPVLATIVSQYPWTARHLAYTPVSDTFFVDPYRVHVWEVNHGHNGRSHGYRFERDGRAWAYVPDCIALNEAEQAPLRNLDLLILGTAYYKEGAPIGSRSLYDMVEAVELLADIRPARTVFTHLSHAVDRRLSYELPAGVTVGYDGLRVPLP